MNKDSSQIFMVQRIILSSASLLLFILAASLTAQAQPRCPVISIKGPAESKLGKTITYEAKLKDYGGRGMFKWSVVGGTIVEGQGTKKIKVTPNSRNVRVEVKLEIPPRDNPPPLCKIEDATKTKIVDFPNSPPIVSAASATELTVFLACPDGTMPAACAENSARTTELRLNVQDPDGDQPLYTWTVQGGFISGANPFSWQLPDSPGTYIASVVVSDGAGGEASVTFKATVAVCASCGGVDPLTAVIFGVVKDADGRSVSGATVSLVGNTSQTTTTGPDGNYQFTNLALGFYRVNARLGARRGTGTTTLRGATDQAEVNIVIR